MNHLLLPMLIFLDIELVAYAQGMTMFATLAGTGMWLCWGMSLGWSAWERTHKKED